MNLVSFGMVLSAGACRPGAEEWRYQYAASATAFPATEHHGDEDRWLLRAAVLDGYGCGGGHSDGNGDGDGDGNSYGDIRKVTIGDVGDDYGDGGGTGCGTGDGYGDSYGDGLGDGYGYGFSDGNDDGDI